jgi:hypothetical protein
MSLKSSGFDDFEKILLSKAIKLPKESMKIMRKMGSKARTVAARKSRSEVNKVTGNYHKGWKRGKAWVNDGEYKILVKNYSPHAHLIEDGHRIVNKSGEEKGFKEGKHVLEKAMNEFGETLMEQMLEEWLEELLDGGKL